MSDPNALRRLPLTNFLRLFLSLFGLVTPFKALS